MSQYHDNLTCPHHHGLSISLQYEVILSSPGIYPQSILSVAEQPGLSCAVEGVRDGRGVGEEGPEGDVGVGVDDQQSRLVPLLTPPVERPEGEAVSGCAED